MHDPINVKIRKYVFYLVRSFLTWRAPRWMKRHRKHLGIETPMASWSKKHWNEKRNLMIAKMWGTYSVCLMYWFLC